MGFAGLQRMRQEMMTNEAINILPLPKAKKPPVLTKTPDAHIYTLAKTGVKYLKKSICGKVVSRSLRTKSQEVARRKAQTIIEQEYKRRHKCADENITFKELADEFKLAIEADTKLKPRSKAYRLETLAQLERTWPELYEKKPSEITSSDCERWAEKCRAQFSPTRFNGTLETLRRILEVGIENGALSPDPTAKIERASVPLVVKDMPEMSKLQELIEALDNPVYRDDTTKGRESRKEMFIYQRRQAAKTLKYMLFTGCRPEAARRAGPDSINLARNEVSPPMVKYDNKPVRVPIVPEARKFFEQLLADYPGKGPLLPTADPSIALASACKEVGIPKLTPKHMRDLFATIALQHTKDVALVASWLGHKDKGVTLLKRYAHVLNDHSQASAKKVRFFK